MAIGQVERQEIEKEFLSVRLQNPLKFVEIIWPLLNLGSLKLIYLGFISEVLSKFMRDF